MENVVINFSLNDFIYVYDDGIKYLTTYDFLLILNYFTNRF